MREMEANLTNVSVASNAVQRLSDEEKEDLMLFFKNCIIPRDKPKLLETLKETISFRKEIFALEATRLANCFAFYFTSPDIVSNYSLAHTMRLLLMISFTDLERLRNAI